MRLPVIQGVIRRQLLVNFRVDHVQSSCFADTSAFPCGSVAFDHALLMRNLNHQ